MLVGWALRSAPAELARLLAHFCLSLLAGGSSQRIGVCSLVHEEAAWQRLEKWFSSWETGFTKELEERPGRTWNSSDPVDGG